MKLAEKVKHKIDFENWLLSVEIPITDKCLFDFCYQYVADCKDRFDQSYKISFFDRQDNYDKILKIKFWLENKTNINFDWDFSEDEDYFQYYIKKSGEKIFISEWIRCGFYNPYDLAIKKVNELYNENNKEK